MIRSSSCCGLKKTQKVKGGRSRENKKAFQKGTAIRISGYCSIMWKYQRTPPETIWCQCPRQTTAWTKMGHQMNLGGVHFIGQTQNSSSSPVSLVHGARWLGTALNGGVIAAPGLPAGRHPDCALHTETPFKCLNRIISGTPGSTRKGFLTHAHCLGLVSPKMTIPSSCTHPQVVPNPKCIVATEQQKEESEQNVHSFWWWKSGTNTSSSVAFTLLIVHGTYDVWTEEV